jgi:ankyrin repeat protein
MRSVALLLALLLWNATAAAQGLRALDRELIAAAERGDASAAARLIGRGADVNAKDEKHDSAFLVASARGRTEVVKLALAAGADLKSTNRYGGTGLIPACHYGHLETVRLLLSTPIDVNHVNNLGWTALLEAVILGDGGPVHTEIVRLLLAHGADAAIADREGVTPVEHARRRGYREMARILAAGR